MKTLQSLLCVLLLAGSLTAQEPACCYMVAIPKTHIKQFNALLVKRKAKVQQRHPVGDIVVVWYCCNNPIKTEGCVGVDFRIVEPKPSPNKPYEPK